MNNDGTLQELSVGGKRSVFARIKNSQYLYLAAAFFLPFTIMLGIYACLEVHPFGNSTILTLDFQAQYIYYYEEIRRLLTEGGSWLYSWSRTLGGEFMGIVAYYMASPFNIVLVLFPKGMIADAVMFIQCLKIGAMGLTFGIYLHKTRRPSDMMTLAFSMMYALCGYAVIQTIDPMWLDALVFLPLLILGTEKLIKEKKVILYISALSMIFITNYYIGYMCGIFTFLYYIYYYSVVSGELGSLRKEGDRIPVPVRTFLRFAFSTLLSIMISAFMLWSAWLSLGFGKTGFSVTDFSVALRFDFLDLFVKMLPGSYDTVRPNGLPIIYSGILALIALPLYFVSKKIPVKRKIASAVLLTVLVMSFMVNTIDLVWHGFSAPNWLNYRYSFVFIFFVITMACDAVMNLDGIKGEVIAGTGVAICALICVIQKLDIEFAQDSRVKELSDSTCILLSLVLTVAYIAVLFLFKNDKSKSSASFALAVVVCVEAFAGGLINLADTREDVGALKYDNYLSSSGGYEYYDSFNGPIRRMENLVEKIQEADGSFYRMESTAYRKPGGVNEPMGFGYYGISHSTSTLNADVIRMMRKLGYASTSHWTKYIGGTPVSDALLGIKYVITKGDKLDENIYNVVASEDEYYKYIVSKNKMYALSNKWALGPVYGVSSDVVEMLRYTTYPPYISEIDYQNNIIDAMLNGTDGEGITVLKGIYAAFDAVNCSFSSFTQDHTFTVDGVEHPVSNPYYSFSNPDGNAKVVFTFKAEEDGPIYAQFPVTNFGKSADLYVNGNTVIKITDSTGKPEAYFKQETSCIVNIGTFKKGDTVTVELRLRDDALYISKASPYYFYYVDYVAFDEAYSYLSASSMSIDSYGNDYLEGTIDLPEDQTFIFTSIPYDEGWKVYIDGKAAETVEVMDSLLGVQSTTGFHDIKFVYRPVSYTIGMPVSIIGIIIFAALIVFTYNKKAHAFWVDKVARRPEPLKCLEPEDIEGIKELSGEEEAGEALEASDTENTGNTDKTEEKNE